MPATYDSDYRAEDDQRGGFRYAERSVGEVQAGKQALIYWHIESETVGSPAYDPNSCQRSCIGRSRGRISVIRIQARGSTVVVLEL